MKFVTFEYDGSNRIGAVVDQTVYDLRGAYESYLDAQEQDPQAEGIAAARLPADTAGFLRGGEKARQAADLGLAYARKVNLQVGNRGQRVSFGMNEVRLRAPVQPRTILCGGLNYGDHLQETGSKKPSDLELFLKSPHSVCGPGDPLIYQPRLGTKLDYEVELAIIIGRPARYVKREDALKYVFGFTVSNDASVRDRQSILHAGGFFEHRLGESKSFDHSCPLGPWIVTTDELPDPAGLAVKSFVNGEPRQNSNTKHLIWNVPMIIEIFSTYMTLEPGFLILTGTPGGTALGNDPEMGGTPYHRGDVVRGGYLRPGDIVRCEIEGIGALENPVIGE